MGRGSGDQAAGTASALRISEDNTLDTVIDLSDKGERFFLDARMNNKKSTLWHSLAAGRGLSLVDIFDDDSDLRENLEKSLSQPVIAVFHSSKRPEGDVEDFLASFANKKDMTAFDGNVFEKHPEAILFLDDTKGYYKSPPAWLQKSELCIGDGVVFHLTTEELGLLATGTTLTLAEGEKVFRVGADDLDCSTRELAEGKPARAGNVVLQYS